MAEWKSWELRLLEENKSAVELSSVMDHSVKAIRRRRYELTGSYIVDADLEDDEETILYRYGSCLTKEEKIARIYNLAKILGVKIL